MERYDGMGAAGRYLAEYAVTGLDVATFGGPEADCAQRCLDRADCVAASWREIPE